MASDPRPGEIYAIKPGDNLLLITGRAYGVKDGSQERLRLAQKINAHPYNSRFWRAPSDGFERQNFPDGIASFGANFTRDDPQRRAEKGEARSFPRIFIPPREDLVHPRLGPGTALPLPQGSGAPGPLQPPVPNPCGHLDHPFINPSAKPSIGKTDDRQLVADPLAGIPHRWICSIVVTYQDAALRRWVLGIATGVRIGPRHVLTAAHVVRSLASLGQAWQETQTVAAALVFGRNGMVAPDKPGVPPGPPAYPVTGSSNFWVPPEWSEAIGEKKLPGGKNSDLFAFDYGLIRFDPAKPCPLAAAQVKAPSHWTEDFSDTGDFWRHLALGQSLHTAGYPGDKPYSQWASDGPLRRLPSVGKSQFQKTPKNAWMSFDADFAAGMSGSPVWKRIPGGGTNSPDRLVLAGIAGSSRDDAGITYAAALTPFAWDRLRTEMARP